MPTPPGLTLCASPWGKVALLSALGALRGLRQWGRASPSPCGTDRQFRIASARIRGVVVGDSRQPPIRPGVDRVLLDVPCTGLGVVRRRPELRWRRTPSDVPALKKLQTQLLTAALDLVRPGGVVAYVTCSPHIAETELVVSSVVRRRDDVVVEDSRGCSLESRTSATAPMCGSGRICTAPTECSFP